LEINIRMRRGLSLILGDVGTGKTTLGARFASGLSATSRSTSFTLILNPLYQSEFQFLEALCKMFRVGAGAVAVHHGLPGGPRNIPLPKARRRRIKQRFYFVDEGQNLSLNLIEVLRSLLNYETNEHKLLQLVVLGQLEALAALCPNSEFHGPGEHEIHDQSLSTRKKPNR
jgi:general secretion pathway protein A